MNYYGLLQLSGWEGRRRGESLLVRPGLAMFPDVKSQGVEGSCGPKQVRTFWGQQVPVRATDRGKDHSQDFPNSFWHCAGTGLVVGTPEATFHS